MRHVSALGPVAAGLFLLAAVPAHAAPACVSPPGVIVTTDPAGDMEMPDGSSAPLGTPATQAYDILSVNLAETAPQGRHTLIATLQVGSLNPLPPSSFWWVHIWVGGKDYFLSMRTPDPSGAGGKPVFEYGTVTHSATGGTFSFAGPIDADSTYDATNGTITYVVSTATFGTDSGAAIVVDKVEAEAGAFGGTIAQPVVTNPLDDTSNGEIGSYGFCRVAPPTLPPAASNGLQFSATLVDELQYYEGEPLVTTDLDGTVYTCGPAGSGYPAADYAQASLDGGDQFNRLGDPTTGRMGLMGGGDCAMATGLERNSQGNYQLAYSGLSNLLQFTVSTSPDKGKTLTNVPMSSSAPDVDRQWLAFTDAMNVFMIYKLDSVGMVQKSTDGGLTYGPEQVVQPNPGRLGPIRSMNKDENPAKNGKAALYYPWTLDNSVAMAISLDAGATWNNCLVVKTKGSPASLFSAMDHDTAGNVYLAYSDQANNNAYMVAVPAKELLNCKDASGAQGGATTLLKALPPVQMNRDKAVTTVMPWIAAGGAPGRVAVSFYASPVRGAVDNKDLPHVWDVYVSQSLNALDSKPSVEQVKVTTHPLHYDQICIGGLGCATGGDRSLSDFFSIAYNKQNGELVLVFDRSGKKPGDGDSSSGPVTATSFARQIAGASNGGGFVANNGRQVLRQSAEDPVGDAYGGFSNLVVAQDRYQLPALDLTSVSVNTARDLKTREVLEDGGMTVTLHVKDLSDAALGDALSQSNGQSLVWMFYFWDGFTPHAAAATWDGSSFSFGFSGATQNTDCVVQQAVAVVGCAQYRFDTTIDGKVDQAAGVIEMTVPLSMLKALADVPAPARSPAEVAAHGGDRMHSAAAYSFVNLTGITQDPSQTLMPVDNTAAMDFVIPPGLIKASNESACVLPGITVVTSPSGSASEGLPTGQDDLLAVHFAEPSEQPGKLVITMNVASLNPAPPPGYRWITYFFVPNDPNQYWVGMSTADANAATPVFLYGTRETLDAVATTAGTYTVLGTVDGSWTPDGTIQVTLDTNTAPFALKSGDVLSGIAGSIRRSTPDATNNFGLTVDSADGVNYTIVKNACAASGGKSGESHGVLLGGALGFFTLLPLFGAGFLRRRKHN